MEFSGRIEVHFTPAQVDELYLKDKVVVVVDVLRSSTTIAAALSSGAKEIIPVANVESAVKISGSLFGDVTLRGGERNGKTIEGFNLGNSPLEYTTPVVKGKSIIYLTSNGTPALVKGRYSKTLMVCGFVNITAVAAALRELNGDVVIICSGKDHHFCLEDAVCAGRLLAKLRKFVDNDLAIDDGGEASLVLDKAFGKNLLKTLKACDHGRFLTEIGYEEDLKFCAALDSLPVVPVFNGSTVRLAKETARQAVPALSK